MFFVIVMMILTSTISCQSLENGWKDIKPLHSNKGEVEKIFGEPKIVGNNSYRYTTDDAYVEVKYATAPCKESQYGRGVFRVPENTVLEYHVYFKEFPEFPRLSDIKLDKRKYEKDTSGDAPFIYSYWNRDGGIRLSVNFKGDVDRVQGIAFSPSKIDEEKFACK